MDEEYERAINILTGALKLEQTTPRTGRNPQDQVDATSCATSKAPEQKDTVPIGISNRHIHLSQADLDTLFGTGYQLTKLKDLSQPGQFASKETVMLAGPKGSITKVRILGPVRSHTQIEILASDQFKLGAKAPVRLSGHLDGTPGITVVGPKTSIQTPDGLIIAQRHIHMLPQQAIEFGVHDGQTVSLEIEGLRGGILNNVIIRAKAHSGLECHIDTEEANALGVTSGMPAKIKIIGGNE
ncbi:phosphate propanoyltransferase [Lacticaseibacillus baoqingensis]|uniref:Phosphate propanoyltransferase n=1 Tax=Lacticaseibacillus baoqingensis TaxID=2486013 RepID=A0ABW4E8W7_9LACO|nr:phosphate propanoyltransferase [Lacticaseibacillus baoqingensis]